MSSIRKTKKAMKKSNGFFSVVVDNGMVFCVSEWYIYGKEARKEFYKYKRKK